MSQLIYRANLSQAVFPILSETLGRTTILRSSKGGANLTDEQTSLDLPQVLYMHNVMPTQSGLRSIGFTQVNDETDMRSTYPDQNLAETVDMFTGEGRRIGLTSKGRLYQVTSGTTTYLAVTLYSAHGIDNLPTNVNLVGREMTSAKVSGRGYVCFKYPGLNTHPVFRTLDNGSLSSLYAAPMTGLNTAQIQGITASFGRLIVWGYTSTSETDHGYWVAWSSNVDPTDFTPSLLTGAGAGEVEALRGRIVTCVPSTNGFLIFSTENVVAAIYTGNPRFPFDFREVPGAGGIRERRHVTANSPGRVFAYTKAGLQLVTETLASPVFQEVREFIEGNVFEDFDEATGLLTRTEVSRAMRANGTRNEVFRLRLSFVANRYLAISYGLRTSDTPEAYDQLTENAYSHVIVYDTVLERPGKIKLPHIEVFQQPGSDKLALVNLDGKILAIDMVEPEPPTSTSLTNIENSGVLILGKFQYINSRHVQLQHVECENVETADDFSVTMQGSYDGKNIAYSQPGYLAESSQNYRKYNYCHAARNFALLIEGKFNLTCLILSMNLHGKR